MCVSDAKSPYETTHENVHIANQMASNRDVHVYHALPIVKKHNFHLWILNVLFISYYYNVLFYKYIF